MNPQKYLTLKLIINEMLKYFKLWYDHLICIHRLAYKFDNENF